MINLLLPNVCQSASNWGGNNFFSIGFSLPVHIWRYSLLYLYFMCLSLSKSKSSCLIVPHLLWELQTLNIGSSKMTVYFTEVWLNFKTSKPIIQVEQKQINFVKVYTYSITCDSDKQYFSNILLLQINYYIKTQHYLYLNFPISRFIYVRSACDQESLFVGPRN